MLVGTHSSGIDPKNRLVIPPDFRDAFVGGGYVSDQGNYVALFPSQEFREFVVRIQRDIEAKVVGRSLLRTVTANSYPFTLDSAHRVLLPAPLRQHLPEDGNVLLVGASTHVGVWDPERVGGGQMSREELAGELDAYW